jgi:holo-[acyl-carrier protein] synthase
MPNLAAGIDMVEIDRVRRVLKRFPQRFLERVYTPVEVAVCRGRVHELAARFAAKEAAMKALGTGARGLAWREIEVLPNRRGKPLLYLYGRARERAEEIVLHGLDVSLSHTREHALAIVVGVQEAGIDEPGVARDRLLRWLQERGRL